MCVCVFVCTSDCTRNIKTIFVYCRVSTIWYSTAKASNMKQRHPNTRAEKKKPRMCNPFSKRHLALLNALCHANPRERKALLRGADRAFVKCICECALNILKGVVRLKPVVKKHLKKYKNILRRLALTKSRRGSTQSGGGSWRTKKRIILQKGCGAFLPLLLAPVLTSLLGKIFGNAANNS